MRKEAKADSPLLVTPLAKGQRPDDLCDTAPDLFEGREVDESTCLLLVSKGIQAEELLVVDYNCSGVEVCARSLRSEERLGKDTPERGKIK